MKFYQYGRSMVEMLGVLAIIGVLSVGAIAGYSKAMMKYKLNKQAEQLTTVINAGLRYAGQWNFNESFVDTLPYLIKLGEIPEEMIRNDTDTHIYDVFNTSIELAYTKTDTEKYTQFFIMLNTSRGDEDSLSICRNIVTTAKEFHQNVQYIAIVSKNSSSGYDDKTYLGDKYCGTERCMKDLTVSKIDEWCRYNIGKTDTPHIKIVWDE